MVRNGKRKKAGLTKSQQKITNRTSYKKQSQKIARVGKAQFAIKQMVDRMVEGEQFVDFSDSPHAIYGAGDFHRNMLSGALLNASSTTSAELSKIRVMTDGTGRSPGGEWQRLKINSAEDGRTMRVLEASARDAAEVLKHHSRLPKTAHVAIDLHFEERWDGARRIKPGVSEAQDKINREARDRLAGERGLVKSRPSRGTTYFEAYIVAQIVDKGVQVVLACMRVDDLSNLARFIPVLAEKIRAAGVSRAMLLLDRVFFNEADIRALNQTGFRWIVPCRNTGAVKAALADADAGGKKTGVRRMVITGKSGAQSEYWMRHEPRKRGEGEPGEGRSRGGRKGRKKREAHQRLIGFAMSHMSEKPRKYRKRWGIETRFRMVTGRRNKTSSTKPPARMLAFVYSLFTTNTWVMINSVFWRRASDYVPRISLAAVISMSVRMLEIREPKPPP